MAAYFSSTTAHPSSETIAKQLTLTGHVQGVGFRPFVYRLAIAHDIQGWVKNKLGSITIHAQGSAEAVAKFKRALVNSAPPLSKPTLQEIKTIKITNQKSFVILDSAPDSEANVYLPPDYYLCPDCFSELFDKNNRRYRYPFINCTQCGPRYTLIKRLPYDRQHTTMADFTLCPACRQEYNNPSDRRFHAEPIACSECGPQIQFYSQQSGLLTGTEKVLQHCVAALHSGAIVAVKGIGGYHLMCDARNNNSIRRLRHNKPRPHKPLAVMFPLATDKHQQRTKIFAALAPMSVKLLLDPMRPIVLLPKHEVGELSAEIAPGLNEVGVFLPYSPLHALLLHDFAGPLVATSANISGEPVMTNNQQVEERLANVADAFLHHNRPIERPADDAVFRIIANKPRPLRLGRGIAPLELTLPIELTTPILAVGGHMKNTIALAWKDRIVISPHIGDLDAPRSLDVFQQVCTDLQRLYQVQAKHLVCDAHPGYASSRWVKQDGRPCREVFHHHAHASSIAGEHVHEASWLVFTWDGVGYGEDASLWGGETFYGQPGHWQRIASLQPFYLPGGEKAGRDPWRSALALCWEAGLDWSAPVKNTELLHKAWLQRLNSPQSSAMGRLFDAAAALTGICEHASFEGQGPMLLEACAQHSDTVDFVALDFDNNQKGLWSTDWSGLLPMLLDKSRSVADRAACFHHSLAHHILQQCRYFREKHGDFAVGLSGGVFQNKLLTEEIMHLLKKSDFRVYFSENIPCNDGGLCYGQIIEVAYQLSN